MEVSKTDKTEGKEGGEGKTLAKKKTHGVSWQGEGKGTQTVGGPQ